MVKKTPAASKDGKSKKGEKKKNTKKKGKAAIQEAGTEQPQLTAVADAAQTPSQPPATDTIETENNNGSGPPAGSEPPAGPHASGDLKVDMEAIFKLRDEIRQLEIREVDAHENYKIAKKRCEDAQERLNEYIDEIREPLLFKPAPAPAGGLESAGLDANATNDNEPDSPDLKIHEPDQNEHGGAEAENLADGTVPI